MTTRSPLYDIALSMVRKWSQPNPTGQRVCSMVAGPLILPAIFLMPCTDPLISINPNALIARFDNIEVCFEYDSPQDFKGVATKISAERGTGVDGVLVYDVLKELPGPPNTLNIGMINMPGYRSQCSVRGSDIENILFNFPLTLSQIASQGQ